MIRAIKGTRDLLPPDTAVWNRVERIAHDVFRTYNYHEIRTPILEETQLFARGVGQETDIVSKEMYTFEDRDGSSLTLRPENTTSAPCSGASVRRKAATASSSRSAPKPSAPNRPSSTPKLSRWWPRCSPE